MKWFTLHGFLSVLLGVILWFLAVSIFADQRTIYLYVDGVSYECALPEELSELATVEWGGLALPKYVLESEEGTSFFMLDAGIAQFWMYCYAGYACDGNCAVQLIRMPFTGIEDGEAYLNFRWWLHSFARDGKAKVDRITQEQAEWWIKLFKSELYSMLPPEMLPKTL